MKGVKSWAMIGMLAVAGLLIVGCGGDAEPESVASDICSYEAACYEEEEGESISQDEINECVDYEAEYFEDLRETFGQDCLNAYEDLVSCGTGLACDATESEFIDRCEMQMEEYESICYGQFDDMNEEYCDKALECELMSQEEYDGCVNQGGGVPHDPDCADAIRELHECEMGLSCDEFGMFEGCSSERDEVQTACW